MARALKEQQPGGSGDQGMKLFEFWLPDLGDPEVLASAEAAAKRIADADLEDDISGWLDLSS